MAKRGEPPVSLFSFVKKAVMWIDYSVSSHFFTCDRKTLPVFLLPYLLESVWSPLQQASTSTSGNWPSKLGGGSSLQ